MGGAKGAWIDAIRVKDKLVSRDKHTRLKFTKLSIHIFHNLQSSYVNFTYL